jgi:hypothetical protein
MQTHEKGCTDARHAVANLDPVMCSLVDVSAVLSSTKVHAFLRWSVG